LSILVLNCPGRGPADAGPFGAIKKPALAGFFMPRISLLAEIDGEIPGLVDLWDIVHKPLGVVG
jgi:hypothetical protein